MGVTACSVVTGSLIPKPFPLFLGGGGGGGGGGRAREGSGRSPVFADLTPDMYKL